MLSQLSQYRKERIYSDYVNISYRRCNALYNFAVISQSPDYLLSLTGTEPHPPRETPLFVSKRLRSNPPVGGAWRPTMVAPQLDPILLGVSKASKATDEMCCVCVCVCVNNVITL